MRKCSAGGSDLHTFKELNQTHKRFLSLRILLWLAKIAICSLIRRMN